MPERFVLNYLGIVCCLVGLILFFFVKPEQSGLNVKRTEDRQMLVDDPNTEKNYGSINTADERKSAYFYDTFNPWTKRLVGVSSALYCGIAAAFSYIPILYIENNYPNSSQDQNEYAFSYNTGIFFGALFIFIVYALVTRNRPKVYPQLILPTFVSGLNLDLNRFV